MEYEIINPAEELKITRALLEKHYISSPGTYAINAADCRIYMRGKVWVIEYKGDVLYYETHSETYPFFETAFHYMNVQKRAAWKTVGQLITFRQAIREATVQGTDYCETILEEPLTIRIYQKFMRFARAHDLCHHGSQTF